MSSSNHQPKKSNFRLWSIGLGVLLVGALAITSQMTGASTGNSTPVPNLTHVVKRENLDVTFVEQGVLESSENTEIKCKVRGQNTIIWVVENGSYVEPGDVLVRLDTLAIEDAINERSKFAHWSRSGAENSKANVARSRLAIQEYLEGRFVTQMAEMEKQLAITESNLRLARNSLEHSKRLEKKGFVFQREVDQRYFTLKQAEIDLKQQQSQIEVLKKYTKAIQVETLKGNLAAAEATHAANVERAELDEKRRDQAVEEFQHCVVKAEKAGLVIYPKAKEWKETPDIAEGVSVHKDQTLLLMPDLKRMQVKIGVDESFVDRIGKGLVANIKLPEVDLVGQVSSVASVARPAGWWTGNVVKYDTIIELPSRDGLRPGMSAEVEIIVAQHKDVLTIPVTAVLETETESLCWVLKGEKTERRTLSLGDNNDVFIVVKDGLSEGEQVVLNPLAFVEEAQEEALKTLDETKEQKEETEPPPPQL